MGKSITVVIAAPFAPASLGLALVSALPRWRVDAFGGGRYVSVVPLLLVSYFVSLAALLLLDTGNRKEHKTGVTVIATRREAKIAVRYATASG